MVVLYRDKRGRFISKHSAKRRKSENVLTELRQTVTGKSLRLVSGYHPFLKPLRKKKRIAIPPSIRPKPKAKKRKLPTVKAPVVEEEEEEFEEEPVEEISEDYEPSFLEEIAPGEDEDILDWQDFSSGDDDFDKALERLNDLDDILDYPEDDDWYEET